VVVLEPTNFLEAEKGTKWITTIKEELLMIEKK